ncbi:MAG: hypothetical protein IJT94_08505 [Oscillibacter sp.]|nr:hypothetical protein [Oscillibacter sp.]
MAYVIIPNAERRATTNRILEQYGANRRDPAMREAAEIVAVRQEEAIQRTTQDRRYYG